MSESGWRSRSRLKPKWPPRRLALYLTATIFGGVVLVLFLVLLYMLYWMELPTDLPNPRRLIHPQCNACLVILIAGDETGSRTPPTAVAAFLPPDTPAQVAKLIRKGINEPRCPILIVRCLIPGADRTGKTLTISLGRYPGMFWVVRHHLQRRWKKGELPFTLRLHRDKPIFVNEQITDGRFNTFSIAACSVLYGSSERAVAELIDGLLADTQPPPATPAALTIQDPQHPGTRLLGWSRSFRDAQLQKILSPGPARKLQALRSSLAKDVPEVGGIRDIRWRGELTSPALLELSVDFRPDHDAQAPALAHALAHWLRRSGHSAGIETVSAETSGDRIRLSLKIALSDQ